MYKNLHALNEGLNFNVNFLILPQNLSGLFLSVKGIHQNKRNIASIRFVEILHKKGEIQAQVSVSRMKLLLNKRYSIKNTGFKGQKSVLIYQLKHLKVKMDRTLSESQFRWLLR